MFGNHGLCGLLEEGAHEKSPKCLGGNLGDFGGILQRSQTVQIVRQGEATPYWFKVNPLYFQAITDILSIQQKRFPNLFFYILIFDNIFPLIPFVIS